MFLAQAGVIATCFRIELRFQLLIQQRIDHAHCARGIEHMHSAGMIMRRDFHCRVRAARRRAANQQWQLKSLAVHFLRDVHHLIERRCDQPT